MPKFHYKAKSGPDKTVTGEIDAENRTAAVAVLDSMGYMPVTVEETIPAGEPGRRLLARRPGFRDVTVFTRQLSSLLRSGVPILRALGTIAEQTENSLFRRLMGEVTAVVRDGTMLSDALARYPSLFPEVYINMVRSGEAGGVLDSVLNRLADAREKEEDIRRKVQSALAYPVLVILVGVATVFVLLAFFLPRVIVLFKDYTSLPLPTRILLKTSEAVSESWYLILLGLVLVGAVVNRLLSLESGRLMCDGFKLRVPVFGRFVRDSDIARFARTLAVLIDSGIAVDKALVLSARTMRNSLLRRDVEAACSSTIRDGASLSSGFRRVRAFPPLVANMAAVGEEAGRLDEAMTEVAVFYERECDQHSRVATSLLEPVLILVVGALVGFIVAAMLLPIFELRTGR